jgi:hypothetical protein
MVLSLRESRPSGLRMVPGGRPLVFSTVPTVASDLIFLITGFLLSLSLKNCQNPKNQIDRFFDKKAHFIK